MFEKLDKIVLTEDDYAKVSKWNNENRDKFTALDVPLSEGLIYNSHYMEEYDATLIQITYFHFDEDRILFRIFDEKDMSEVMSFEMNMVDDEPISNMKMFGDIASKKHYTITAQLTIMLVTDVLQYISNAPQHVKETKETKVINKKQKSKKSSKNNKSRQVKINTVKYTFDFSEEYAKRHYERSAESWSVRGHWRIYKGTGKRVWIKPHVKGSGENIEPKEYRI